MKTVNVKQGTPEWHAHRASYYNASDAAAILGCSLYETRSQLLHRVATGITPEVDAQTQKRFDEGHRFEALAMPLAEKIINEPLYQIVGTDGVLSASFDGLTIDGAIAWEHKTLNQALREVMTETCTGADLPKNYRVQMQQQLMVSGAEKVLFMASEWDGETLIEARHCWYKNDPALTQEIIEGWKQFDFDRINYVAPAPVAVAIGTAPETLPALFIQVSGQVTASNLQEYKAAALAVIGSINKTLVTDDDFADAKKAVKWCGEVESKLKAAKENALSQTASIDQLFKVIDEIDAKTRETRLMLNKLVVSEEAARKTAIILEAKQAYAQHIATQLVHPMTDKLTPPDFAAAIKGKSSFVNMQDAVDSMLANAKVAANIQHAKLSANLEVFDRETSGYLPIFQDVGALLHKEPDDLVRLIQARIAERKAYDVAQLEALQRANDAKAARQAEIAALSEDLERLGRLGRLADVNKGVHFITSTPPPIESAQTPTQAPTLRLGQICERLGFGITGDFLKQLGFEPAATDKRALLFHEESFKFMCEDLVKHIRKVQLEFA